MIKLTRSNPLKAFCGVAPSTADVSVNNRGQMWLVKLAIVHIDVTCIALSWRPLEHSRRCYLPELRRSLPHFARKRVTGTTGHRGVRAGEFERRHCVLLQREGWTAKRTLVVTCRTITPAESTAFELAVVGVLMTVLACR